VQGACQKRERREQREGSRERAGSTLDGIAERCRKRSATSREKDVARYAGWRNSLPTTKKLR
jgi:hypothetical protein